MNGVSVKRLGKVVPAETENQLIDPRPIVLWSGENPAAVLLYRVAVQAEGGPVEQELAPIRESVADRLWAAGGGFPVMYRTKQAGESEAKLFDKPDLGGIYAADLNGDGMDELIIAKQTGGVDLVGWKKAIAHYGASHKPAVASYRLAGTQIAQLPGRAVVHLLFERIVNVEGKADPKKLAQVGAGDPYVLLRVDGQGISRVLLGGPSWPVTEMLAVGAINRPDSSDVDELVALSRRDQSYDVYVSRHRPDGALIDAPRKVYVPLSWSWSSQYRLAFVPQSRVALVVSHDEQIYFLEAEKPVNWVRAVDLKALAGLKRLSYLGAVDGSSNVKALFAADEPTQAVYAIDVDGKFYTANGGPFAPAAKPAPLYRLQPRSEQHSIHLVPSATRGDEFLVVHYREQGTRKLSREEIDQAADRFLMPEAVAGLRRDAEPSLEGKDPIRDPLIAEERKKRGVHQEIKTIDEWRRLLPDSYAATVRDNQNRLYARLGGRLDMPLEDPATLTPRRYRDIEAFRSWLAGIDLPPEVVFDLVRRGGVVRSFRVDGSLDSMGPTALIRDWIEWRAGNLGVAVVTTLSMAGPDGKREPGLYAIRADLGGR